MYDVSKRENPYWFYIGADEVVEVYAHGHAGEDTMILDIVFSSPSRQNHEERLLLTRIESRKGVLESLLLKIKYAMEHPISHGGIFDPAMIFHMRQDRVRRRDLYALDIGSDRSKTLINVKLNSFSLKVEKENAQAMIQGFQKDGKRCYVPIFTAHQHAWSLRNDLRQFPKLLTVKHGEPRQEYPLSEIGKSLQRFNYKHQNRFVALLDTVYELKSNNKHMWERLCNMGIFDIWKPEAPYNSLDGKETPMILLLRVCAIGQNMSSQIDPWDYADKIRDPREVALAYPVIPDWKFKQLKNKLRLLINDQLRAEELVQDTCKMGLDDREVIYRKQKGKILICAGKKDIGGILSEELEECGYYVMVAETIEDYGSLIKTETFDLAILTNNGFRAVMIPQLTRDIHDISPDVDVIACSGWLDNDLLQKLREENVRKVYPISIDLDSLLHEIKEMISERNRRELENIRKMHRDEQSD